LKRDTQPASGGNGSIAPLKLFLRWLQENVPPFRRRSHVVLLLVACITALNSYFVYLNRPGPGFVGPFGQPAEAKHFRKTFIFWLPDFSSDLHLRRGTSPEERKAAEEQFTRKLTDLFGGWTRWRVEGKGGDAPIEGGYFYQVSLPKEKPDATVDSIKTIMADVFDQITYYVIEIRHR
jgi:hypothetical protein